MIGWVDASAGASGDMLLGALVGVGVPVGMLQESVDAVAPGTVRLHVTDVRRAGFAATRCLVEIDDGPHPHRTWADVSTWLSGSGLDPAVRARAEAVFFRLAAAEGTVHGIPAQDVTFHEVGALDAIADVVGVCAGIVHLGLERLVVSPVAVGSGRVRTAHGLLPVPVPAVVELLRDTPTLAGPGEHESCTPTGAALLRTCADEFAAQPAMSVATVGIGAGARDLPGQANVVRLLVGDGASGERTEPVVLLEANVDDQDPRLWPSVLADLLAAGAVDAWLVPIVMKKGRPAHTLCALAPPERVATVRDAVFATTTTLGVREATLTRTALERESRAVTVRGHRIRVKIAYRAGRLVNAQPEFDDVARAARELGLPVRTMLAEALAAVTPSVGAGRA